MANRNGIIIKDENAEKMQKVLDAVNGKARVRVITLQDVYYAIDTLQEKFKGINKNEMSVAVDLYAQDFPNSYNGTPISTQFFLLYKNGTWRLSGAGRYTCGTVKFHVLHMSDDTKASIVRQYEKF